MIDYFALALTHALILIALIRLAGREDLDEDPALPDLRKKRIGGLAEMQAKSLADTQDRERDA